MRAATGVALASPLPAGACAAPRRRALDAGVAAGCVGPARRRRTGGDAAEDRCRRRRSRRRSTSSSWIVPATGEGTSASTLSVEISTSGSSTATLSPGFTRHSSTVPSATESPISGKATSTILARRRPRRERRRRRCLPRRCAAPAGAAALAGASPPGPSRRRSRSRRARRRPGRLGRPRRGSSSACRWRGRGPRRRPCRSRPRRSARPAVDRVPDCLEPVEHGALGHRLAHRGHRDLRGRRSGSPSRCVNCIPLGWQSSVSWKRRFDADKFWGWGFEDQQPSPAEVEATAAAAREHLGFEPAEVERPVALDGRRAAAAAARRRRPSLAAICRDRPLRARRCTPTASPTATSCARFRGQLRPPARRRRLPRRRGRARGACWPGARTPAPRRSRSAAARASSAASSRWSATATPARSRSTCAGSTACWRSTRSRARRASRPARPGPALEEQLREHGLTLRHFPQSFEYSTLGGWVATRAGGHFATLATHIDDLVESVRALTPSGVWESRRLPGSGAGPSPDRMLIGSEGILGVITEAWVRVRERPTLPRLGGRDVRLLRARRAPAVRALAQSGLYPSNCRLLDPGEAALTGAAPDGKALLVLGFESADHPVDAALARGLELCADYGGALRAARAAAPERGGARGRLARRLPPGALPARHPGRRRRAQPRRSRRRSPGTASTPSCADACASARRRRSARARSPAGSRTPTRTAPRRTSRCWRPRGAATSSRSGTRSSRRRREAILAAGGTITHHHAVGRDHRPWYDRQRPEPFAAGAAGRQARASTRTRMLNPGVLIDPA